MCRICFVSKEVSGKRIDIQKRNIGFAGIFTSSYSRLHNLGKNVFICFYRNCIPWFVTISHERIAYIDFGTSEDIIFLREHHL